MSIRLIHTGDIHPSSKATLAGKLAIDPSNGKNLLLRDLRNSLNFLFKVATTEETRCDACVIPGDIFDSVIPTMDEVQVMVEWVAQMADEMPCILIPGNHDMGQSGAMASALEPLKLRRNVFILERPESVRLDFDGQSVRFFGLPYPQRGRLLASADHKDKSPEELTAIINHGLAAILRTFTLEFEEGVPNVLLAHGSVANATVGEQPRSLAQDILIPLDELVPFTYTALAHIHRAQQVGPTAHYCGSLCRGNFGEETDRKGFNLVDLAPGVPLKVTFIENPYARVYRTVTARDLDEAFLAAPLDPSIVWRFKDQLAPADEQRLRPVLNRLQAETPFLQLNVELLHEDRARDAGMAGCLTQEEALTRALLGKIDPDDLPAILAKHHALVAEVGQ